MARPIAQRAPGRRDEPVAVSLETLVPADHFYRHLEAKLDLGFVREWARDLYAERGRPSIDPVVFVKLHLVMFFEGIRSERKLVETASLNLGYALDEELPDHSSLTRTRQRLGLPIFERYFERVVDLCQEAGLLWGQKLFFDATKVRGANADLDSLVPRFYHEAKAHVADLFTDDPASAEERGTDPGHPPPPEGLLRLPVSASAADQAGEATEPPWRLLAERRLDPKRPAVGRYRRTTDFRVSPSDRPEGTRLAQRPLARLAHPGQLQLERLGTAHVGQRHPFARQLSVQPGYARREGGL